MNNDCEECIDIGSYCNECWFDLSDEERKAIKESEAAS